MKKLILIFVVLCIIPMVFAELKLDEVRVYVNNDRDYSVDKDGGDINVEKGDVVELVVHLINNMDNITKAKIKGIVRDIESGGDITKNIDWYDIEANGGRSKTLSFTIPNDADADDYDFDLTIDYEYNNGTTDEFEIDFEVIVQEIKSTETELKEVVRNVSTTCSNVIEKMSASFDYIGRNDNLTGELSTCKDERGTYKAQADERERTLIQCQTDRDNYNQDKQECEDKKSLMISVNECKSQTDDAVTEAVNEAKKKKDNTMLGIGAVGLVGWYFLKKRKKTSVHEKFYQEKKIP